MINLFLKFFTYTFLFFFNKSLNFSSDNETYLFNIYNVQFGKCININRLNIFSLDCGLTSDEILKPNV